MYNDSVIPSPVHFAHVQTLPKKRGLRHHVIRVFSKPLGPIDRKTGQPWKKYDGYCFVSTFKRVGYVQALVNVPPRAFWLLRGQIAHKLRLRRLYGYRCEFIDGRWRKRRVVVPIKSR